MCADSPWLWEGVDPARLWRTVPPPGLPGASRISSSKLVLGPEIPQAGAKPDEFRYAPDFVGPLDRGETMSTVPVHDPELFRPESVDEVGRMGGDEDLRPRGVSPQFLGEDGEQPGMKAVLRLFDAQKGRRVRVRQQKKIREHFDRAVGNEPGEEGILERTILETERQATVLCPLRFHSLESRNSAGNPIQNGLQDVWVLLGEILNYVGQILAGAGEMLLCSCLRDLP